VVTGAGSGIGRALAQQLAAAGSALALADIDEPGLKQTIESLGDRSAAVSTHVMDVAEEASVSASPKTSAAATDASRCSSIMPESRCMAILKKSRWMISLADEHQFLGHGFGVKYFCRS